MNQITNTIILTFIVIFAFFAVQAKGATFSKIDFPRDTIKTEKSRKAEREEERHALKHSHKRFMLKLNFIYANLKTTASFELPNGILRASLSLEDNFGLPDRRSFFSGTATYRFTPRSGLYVNYYGLNRNTSYTTDQEYIFMNDTIPVGTSGNSYFNTQVFSIGYLFSILKDPNAFFGAYFNLYLMSLKTGFNSDLIDFNPTLKLIAPLPNVGVVMLFKLTSWLEFHGNVGFFSLRLSDFGGKIYSYDIALAFKPTHWLGLSLSYQEFDVAVDFPSDKINSTIEYNFRGPAFGVSFSF